MADHQPARWTGGTTRKKQVKARDLSAPTPEELGADVNYAPAVNEPEVEPESESGVEAEADGEPEPQAEAEQKPQAVEEIDATDAAKTFAAQHNIDLATVVGTGTYGRITKDDVAALVTDESS